VLLVGLQFVDQARRRTCARLSPRGWSPSSTIIAELLESNSLKILTDPAASPASEGRGRWGPTTHRVRLADHLKLRHDDVDDDGQPPTKPSKIGNREQANEAGDHRVRADVCVAHADFTKQKVWAFKGPSEVLSSLTNSVDGDAAGDGVTVTLGD